MIVIRFNILLFKKLGKYLLTKIIEKTIYFTYNNSEWNQLLNIFGIPSQVIDKSSSSSFIFRLLISIVMIDIR
jgi:hypothetical protein